MRGAGTRREASPGPEAALGGIAALRGSEGLRLRGAQPGACAAAAAADGRPAGGPRPRRSPALVVQWKRHRGAAGAHRVLPPVPACCQDPPQPFHLGTVLFCEPRLSQRESELRRGAGAGPIPRPTGVVAARSEHPSRAAFSSDRYLLLMLLS